MPRGIPASDPVFGKHEAFNPFYALLVVVGTLFVLTACAYCVMAVRAIHDDAGPVATAETAGLLDWLDRHGIALMSGELAVLGLATVGAMTTDPYWQSRHRRRLEAASAAPESRRDTGAGNAAASTSRPA